MPKTRTVRCEQCGEPFETTASNARFCKPAHQRAAKRGGGGRAAAASKPEVAPLEPVDVRSIAVASPYDVPLDQLVDELDVGDEWTADLGKLRRLVGGRRADVDRLLAAMDGYADLIVWARVVVWRFLEREAGR